MPKVKLEAQTRVDMGKGASRRLRRLENKVPAVVYGGDMKPMSIHLSHNKVLKALESEAIYSSYFDLKVDNKVVHVILKDIQRHPYKPIILHMDFQRVSASDVVVKMVPLHFINEELCRGVKNGGMVNHLLNQVEVRCKVSHLPAFIEICLKDLDIDDFIRLSDLKLPSGVHLAVEPEGDHDQQVVSVHLPKVQEEVEEDEIAAEIVEEALSIDDVEDKNEE